MPSIASIFVDFVARTAGFQEGVKTATESLKAGAADMDKSFTLIRSSGDQMTNAMEKSGLKVATAFLGARTIGAAFAKELKAVYDEIDHIPGVPPETIASIHMMQGAFAQTQNIIQQAAASSLAFIGNMAVAIGATLGALSTKQGFFDFNFAMESIGESMGKLHDDMEKAVRLTPAYQAQLLQANDALMRAQHKLQDVGATQADQIDRMMARAAGLKAAASHFAPDDITRAVQPRTEATNLEAEAATKMRELNKQLQNSYESLGKAQDKVMRSSQDSSLTLNQLRERAGELMHQQWELSFAGLSEAAATEKQIKINKDLTYTYDLIAAAQAKVQAKYERMATFVADNLTNAFASALNGAKDAWSKLGETILQELEKILIKILIIKPLFQSIGGAFNNAGFTDIGAGIIKSVTGYATGGRPNPGQVSIVGENGPELFIPDGTGTVVTNSVASSIGGGGGHTFMIDARGADPSVVARISDALIQLAGPGVTEQRAIGAVMSQQFRSAGFRRAMA